MRAKTAPTACHRRRATRTSFRSSVEGRTSRPPSSASASATRSPGQTSSRRGRPGATSTGRPVPHRRPPDRSATRTSARRYDTTRWPSATRGRGPPPRTGRDGDSEGRDPADGSASQTLLGLARSLRPAADHGGGGGTRTYFPRRRSSRTSHFALAAPGAMTAFPRRTAQNGAAVHASIVARTPTSCSG